MTEKSYFWDGTITGDASLAPYDEDEFALFWSSIVSNYDKTSEGVLFTNYSPYNGSLLLTVDPSNLFVTISPGAALVNGRIYINDGGSTFSVSSPNMTYRIILEMNWYSKEVRLRIKGPSPSKYRLVQEVSRGIWEISLWYVRNTAGVITVFDERKFVACGSIHRSFVSAMSGLHGVHPIASNAGTPGVPMLDAAITTIVSQFKVPKYFKYPGVFYFTPVIQAAATGDLYVRTQIKGGNLGLSFDKNIHTHDWSVIAISSANVLIYSVNIGFPTMEFGTFDYIGLEYCRDSSAPSDTIANTVYFVGWDAIFEKTFNPP